MIRFGLCCIFLQEPIRFRTTTAKVLRPLERPEQLQKVSLLCRHNAENLHAALKMAASLNIFAFRILSGLFPRTTHPEVGYTLDDLPDADQIRLLLSRVRDFATTHGIRLSFHPDQFVTLSSPSPKIVASSILELESHADLAEMVGAETITIHGGGAYGDKGSALDLFRGTVERLPPKVRQRLALENDDRLYTPSDLVPVCRDLGIPLVYDVHHHRCNGDSLNIEEATYLAIKTWQQAGREPFFHISSPRNGWDDGDRRPHADYIDPNDFPRCWQSLTATVDVEAKAKEQAVVRLMHDLAQGGP